MKNPPTMWTVKDRACIHLDTTTNLVTQVGRNPHVTSLARVGANLDNDDASTFGKNSLIARTEVSIDLSGNFLAFVALLSGLPFEAHDLRLNATGFFCHLPFEFFNLGLRLGETRSLLLNLFKQVEAVLFNLFVGLFHRLDFTTHGHQLAVVANTVLPNALFFDLSFFFFQLKLSSLMAGFEFGEAELLSVCLFLLDLYGTDASGNLLSELLESGLFLT